MSQGKAWDKEKVIELIKPYLQDGWSITKACQIIGLPQPTFATWLRNDPELQLEVSSWQKSISAVARRNWADKIKAKNYEASKEWLEAVERDEFGTEPEQAGVGLLTLIKELTINVGGRTLEITGQNQLPSVSTADGSNQLSGEVQATDGGEAVREESAGSVLSDLQTTGPEPEDLGSGPNNGSNGEDLAGSVAVVQRPSEAAPEETTLSSQG